MTKGDIIEAINGCELDDLGDILLELAVSYWVDEKGITEDDFLYLAGEVIEERNGDDARETSAITTSPDEAKAIDSINAIYDYVRAQRVQEALDTTAERNVAMSLITNESQVKAVAAKRIIVQTFHNGT